MHIFNLQILCLQTSVQLVVIIINRHELVSAIVYAISSALINVTIMTMGYICKAVVDEKSFVYYALHVQKLFLSLPLFERTSLFCFSRDRSLAFFFVFSA